MSTAWRFTAETWQHNPAELRVPISPQTLVLRACFRARLIDARHQQSIEAPSADLRGHRIIAKRWATHTLILLLWAVATLSEDQDEDPLGSGIRFRRR